MTSAVARPRSPRGLARPSPPVSIKSRELRFLIAVTIVVERNRKGSSTKFFVTS
jgi:hypothetical protein